MASFIPGYEYDIFISYRQKDNKGNKWVSKFIEALEFLQKRRLPGRKELPAYPGQQ
jgi:hypothetical protein